MYQICFNRINVIRKCSSAIITKPMFKGEVDRYNGITVDSVKESFTEKNFNGILDDSLKVWTSEGRGCVWFKVDIKNAFLVPALAQLIILRKALIFIMQEKTL